MRRWVRHAPTAAARYRGGGHCRRPRRLALASLVLLALLLRPGVAAWAQVVCPEEHDRISNACLLGVPGQDGVVVQEALTAPGQTRTYTFRVTQPAAAHIYLGDQWYDIDLALVRDPPPGSVAPGEEIGRWYFVAEARTAERRVLQFVRPEIIVEQLSPDSYTLVVVAGDGRSYDPARPYTLRVALTPPVCAAARDADNRYQLALTIDPAEPTPFSLLSFNAIISPPYSDLFDFDWWLDGVAVPEELRTTLQVAASELSLTHDGSHRVAVRARGVREYPDPEPQYRQVPPTLAIECTFRL
jgi:hypothetical protein